MPRKNEKNSQTITTQLNLTLGNSGDDGRAENPLGCGRSIGDKKSGKQLCQIKLRRDSARGCSECARVGAFKSADGELGKDPVVRPGLVLLKDDFCWSPG